MIPPEPCLQRGRSSFDELFSFRLANGELRFAKTCACFGQLPTFRPHRLLANANGFFEQRQSFCGPLLL